MAKTKPEGTISKRKMVDSAVDSLGDVGPKALHEYILSTYKTDISLQMISSYKSNLKKANGTGLPAGNQLIGLRDLAIVRELLDRMGKDQLQAMIKVLAK